MLVGADHTFAVLSCLLKWYLPLAENTFWLDNFPYSELYSEEESETFIAILVLKQTNKRTKTFNKIRLVTPAWSVEESLNTKE